MRAAGIAYVFMGEQFGGRPDRPGCLGWSLRAPRRRKSCNQSWWLADSTPGTLRQDRELFWTTSEAVLALIWMLPYDSHADGSWASSGGNHRAHSTADRGRSPVSTAPGTCCSASPTTPRRWAARASTWRATKAWPASGLKRGRLTEYSAAPVP